MPIPMQPAYPLRPPISDERLSELLSWLGDRWVQQISQSNMEDLGWICVELQRRRACDKREGA